MRKSIFALQREYEDKHLAYGKIIVTAIPYKSFKEKMRIVKKYTNAYKIDDYDEFLYLERRGYRG